MFSFGGEGRQPTSVRQGREASGEQEKCEIAGGGKSMGQLREERFGEGAVVFG